MIIPLGVTTNLGLAAGFVISEGGDYNEVIANINDHSTDVTTNFEIFTTFTNFSVDGNLVVFTVSESGQENTDLNGDGDTEDNVLHIYDHSTGVTSNLELGADFNSFKTLDGNLVAFITVSESGQENTDLNGDGDTEDNVLHIYDHSTGITTNLEIAVFNFDPIIDGNLVAFLVSERSQGKDLNNDGDIRDNVPPHL